MKKLLLCTFGIPLAGLAILLIFPSVRLVVALTALSSLATGWVALRRAHTLELRIDYLEGSLDAVPQPLTVTDLNMKWIFVNKTTETLLRKKRREIVGHHCSEWQAHICNTDKCGVRSLRNGCPQTRYQQDMGNGTFHSMQVDTTYITRKDGTKVGHIEIVTDIQAQADLSDLHSHLASSLEEMSSTMAEIDSQTHASASSADDARRGAEQTRELIQNGVRETGRLQQAMTAITETSTEITKINKAIDEIAFQTNILALNAAVEAARAGVAGSGFAVVADEVRNLASRSAEAAKRASEFIQRSHEAVSQGSELVSRVTTALTSMDQESRKSDESIRSIAAATAEQAAAISSVTKAVSELGDKALQSAGLTNRDLVRLPR